MSPKCIHQVWRSCLASYRIKKKDNSLLRSLIWQKNCWHLLVFSPWELISFFSIHRISKIHIIREQKGEEKKSSVKCNHELRLEICTTKRLTRHRIHGFLSRFNFKGWLYMPETFAANRRALPINFRHQNLRPFCNINNRWLGGRL